VQNGGFETTTGGSTGQLGFNITATDWTPSADDYDFIFNPSTVTTTGSTGVDGAVKLYGTGAGGSGPLPASGNGGNFLGIDPSYPQSGNVNSISQTISGLTANATYTLSFYWAAAQQTGFNGTTTEGWDFGLGNTSLNVNNGTIAGGGGLPQHTFGGWNFYTTTVTANAVSEALTFLAIGGPSGSQPPIDLLDGVSLTRNNTVPDSSSTAGLLGLGVVAMGVAAGCRRFARA
jgi:hypothetical protein